MNVYQTASNHHYYNNQHNLLIPSPNSSIYSENQLINGNGEDNFYTTIDNANNSLIHMFINNEQRLDQKMTDQFYQNSSFALATNFSPSPSSSFNSSNGSGQIMNWTPNSKLSNSQDESIVLCQLDELTKNLNNQMNDNCKVKSINPHLDLTYNLSNVQTQIDQTDRLTTNYDFNSNSINSNSILNSTSNCPSSSHQINDTSIQQHQFNNLNLIQSPSVIENRNPISNHSSLTSNSSTLHSTTINETTSSIKSTTSKSSINQQSSFKTLSCSNQSIPNNQSIALLNDQSSNQTNQFQHNQTISKVKQEISSNNQFLSVIIGYDSEGRPIRNTANKKERRRTLSINNAFSNLRDKIPNVPSDTKLSKIKTLRLATSYISYLMELLDDSAPMNSKRRLMMTCEDFKVDLQRFKGRSKNSIHLIYPSKFNVS